MDARPAHPHLSGVGHLHGMHSADHTSCDVSGFETILVLLVSDGKVQLGKCFAFVEFCPPQSLPPIRCRSSGLFIGIFTFQKGLNFVALLPNLVVPSNSDYHSAQRNVFWGEKQKNHKFVSVSSCLLAVTLCLSEAAGAQDCLS